MKKRIWSKLALASWLLLLMVTVPLAVYAVDGQIKISQTPSTTFPIVIDQPGSYVLTSNIIVTTLNVNGIEINTDEVTLDLNGHSITGNRSGTGNGIQAPGKNNIIILNGTVGSFGGYGVGISGHNCQLRDIEASNNGSTGISAYAALIVNCTASLNWGKGMDVSGSTIVNAVTFGNKSQGIYAWDSTLTNCTSHGNQSQGIEIIHSSISNCSASGNSGNGINASFSTITSCVARQNAFNGIDAQRAKISACTVNENNNNGMYVRDSSITNCTVYYNNNGIYAEYNARIDSNDIRHNTNIGLYLFGPNNYVIKNTFSNNTSNFNSPGPANYIPTSLTAADAANANIGW